MQTYMDPIGYENVMGLLNAYENAVVEFATYAVGVGVLQRPTVIFEVRAY